MLDVQSTIYYITDIQGIHLRQKNAYLYTKFDKEVNDQQRVHVAEITIITITSFCCVYKFMCTYRSVLTKLW